MSRTSKWEHRTDGWNQRRREERQARPAGRLEPEIAAEEAEGWGVTFVTPCCNNEDHDSCRGPLCDCPCHTNLKVLQDRIRELGLATPTAEGHD